MGFNFGAFAGGAADGYRKQNEDLRKQSEEKRRQKEQERQDEERAKFDEIMKSTLNEHKEGLRINTDGKAMPKLDPYGAEPAMQGMATDAIISNQIAGKTEAPQSVNSIVARGIGMGEEPQQSSRPLSVAAQGITPVAMMAPKQAEPKYREPDHNDKFNMTDKAYSRLLEAGLFDKAREIGQFRTAMLDEKLRTDERARGEAVRAGAIAVKSRNIEAIRAAAKNISQFVPDGMDVNDVQLTEAGKYKVSYGNNAPVEMDENQLMSTMLAAGDTKTLLEYDNRMTQAGMEAARDKQNAKHQDETSANTKAYQDGVLKNQAAELGIKKSDSDATRAEKKAKQDWIAKINGTDPNSPEYQTLLRQGVIAGYYTPKEPSNPYDIKTDDFGNNVTIGNKATGSVMIINPKTGKTTSIPAAGGVAQQGAAQDVTVGGKVIGQASTAEEAKALVAQYKKQTAPPAQQQSSGTQSAPPIAQPPAAPVTKKPRDVREIQAELNQLKKLPSYVNKDVKDAQRARYLALMAERDAAMGYASQPSSPIAGIIGRYGIGR